jgi:hypothetical protein
MVDAAQAMYYHVADPIHNLKLKATLRQTKGKTNEMGKGSASKTFSWQQKCFSPREMHKYSGARGKRQAVTPLETEYREQIKNVEWAEYAKQAKGSKMLLFSAIDRDGFVSEGEYQHKHTDRSNRSGNELTPLAEAVISLPHSQHAAYRPKQKITDRLLRQRPFKSMSIVAAVGFRPATSGGASKEGEVVMDVDQDGDEDDVILRRCGEFEYYEKVLCRLHFFPNQDILFCKPGLAEDLDLLEDDVDGEFNRGHHSSAQWRAHEDDYESYEVARAGRSGVKFVLRLNSTTVTKGRFEQEGSDEMRKHLVQSVEAAFGGGGRRGEGEEDGKAESVKAEVRHVREGQGGALLLAMSVRVEGKGGAKMARAKALVEDLRTMAVAGRGGRAAASPSKTKRSREGQRAMMRVSRLESDIEGGLVDDTEEGSRGSKASRWGQVSAVLVVNSADGATNERGGLGPHVTSFRFKVPGGAEYEYALENTACVPSEAVAELLEKERQEESARAAEGWRSIAGTALMGRPPKGYSHRYCL